MTTLFLNEPNPPKQGLNSLQAKQGSFPRLPGIHIAAYIYNLLVTCFKSTPTLGGSPHLVSG